MFWFEIWVLPSAVPGGDITRLFVQSKRRRGSPNAMRQMLSLSFRKWAQAPSAQEPKIILGVPPWTRHAAHLVAMWKSVCCVLFCALRAEWWILACHFAFLRHPRRAGCSARWGWLIARGKLQMIQFQGCNSRGVLEPTITIWSLQCISCIKIFNAVPACWIIGWIQTWKTP